MKSIIKCCELNRSVYLIMAAGLLFAVPDLLAQTVRTVRNSGFKLSMAGTSNLHDWVMTSETSDCTARFVLNRKGDRLLSLEALKFSMPVGSLKSGHDVMDERTRNTLKADRYAAINYELRSASLLTTQKDQYFIKAKGILSIAGVNKEVLLEVNCTTDAAGAIVCTGKKVLKMTDFGVDPPSFMMGALTTGNEITIDFSLLLK